MGDTSHVWLSIGRTLGRLRTARCCLATESDLRFSCPPLWVKRHRGIEMQAPGRVRESISSWSGFIPRDPLPADVSPPWTPRLWSLSYPGRLARLLKPLPKVCHSPHIGVRWTHHPCFVGQLFFLYTSVCEAREWGGGVQRGTQIYVTRSTHPRKPAWGWVTSLLVLHHHPHPTAVG